MQGHYLRENFVLNCTSNISDKIIYIIFPGVYKEVYLQTKISSYLFL